MTAISEGTTGPSGYPPPEQTVRVYQRFGLNLDEGDQLLFNQFEQTWIVPAAAVRVTALL